VHPQFTGGFDLVTSLVSEGGHQKHFLELTHRFLILDAALVHLHYEGIELSFHGGLVSAMQPDKLTKLHASTTTELLNQHLYLLWTEMNARATKNCHARVQVKLNRSETWLRY